MLRIRHRDDFFFLGGLQGNLIGQFEVREQFLAMRATHEVFFQEFNSAGSTDRS